LENHSLIVYSNHTSLDDVVILLALLVDAFHPPVNALFMRLVPILGLHLYPVVQHYDISSYTRKIQAFEMFL